MRVLAANGFGISVTLTYFIKPSAIIPVIAIVIIELLEWFIRRKPVSDQVWFMAVALLVMVGGSAWHTYQYANQKVQSQTYIQLNKARAIPAIHFMARAAIVPNKLFRWQYYQHLSKKRTTLLPC